MKAPRYGVQRPLGWEATVESDLRSTQSELSEGRVIAVPTPCKSYDNNVIPVGKNAR